MGGNFWGATDGGGPSVARRRLLVAAAGGVMIGLGAVACQAGGEPATAGGAARRAAGPADSAARPRPQPTRQLTRASGSAEPSPAARSTGHASAGPPGSGAAGRPVYYVDDGPKVIALTIDDGPSPVYTPQLLSVLEKYRVRATFSMVGQNVSYYPAIAREVAEAGHTIINHTWDHANLSLLSAARQRTEITRATDVIHEKTGVRPRMFRAPYGAWSPVALAYCASEHLIPLDWSVDPRDWSRPGVSEIVSTIMRTTATGSIILEHDGGGNRAQTVAALKIVIPRLLDDGYRFAIP
jgi:peptidoglycan-N-acetylglucosamine deacetylase